MADTVALSPERRFELSEHANRKVFKRLIPFLSHATRRSWAISVDQVGEV